MRNFLKYLAPFILVIVLSVLALTQNQPTSLSPHSITATTSAQIASTTNAYEWYPVVHVVDGDTIDVQKDGKKVRMRLIGIDTPEVVDPRKPVQCFGKEASQEMHTLVDGTSVRLETDPTQGLYDKYGRLLAYVYAPANVRPEGILINEYLIAQGYAHEYTYRLPYKYQAEFKAAEKAAHEAQTGLWAPNACANS